MTTSAQDTITLVKTLYDLTNNHQSHSARLDKSLAFFAEDCKVVDVPSGMASHGPDGYKQVILFFEEGFPDSRSLSLLDGGLTPVPCTCPGEMYHRQAALSNCDFAMCIASGMGRSSVTAVTTTCLVFYNSLVSSHRRNTKEYPNMT